ncbi:MAG: hypothetical protein II283_03285, partial [Alistipes sp.]|nr:hypothetical protein [Alistipes sp.]
KFKIQNSKLRLSERRSLLYFASAEFGAEDWNLYPQPKAVRDANRHFGAKAEAKSCLDYAEPRGGKADLVSD